MKIRIPFFTLLLTFLALQYAYSQELGEQVYKEVTVNGAKLYKWVVYNSLSEYDENGNLIHSKVFDDGEKWYEYDSKGNRIHRKTSSGIEDFYKYDTKGNRIYFKRNFIKINLEYESWSEFDSNGNEIHYNSSVGSDYWYEYTFYPNGNVKTKMEYLPI